MPAGGSGGGCGSSGGGCRSFTHHRASHYTPRRNDGVPPAPTHPAAALCCQGIGIVVATFVIGAICGAWTSGGHRYALNLGEERLIPVPSGADVTVADDCRGCSSISAWFDSPDLVPSQWDGEPRRWSRNMKLPVTLKADHFQYWYFNARNGSRIAANAVFPRGSGSIDMRLLVIDDGANARTDSSVSTLAEDLWKANRNGRTMALSDAVVTTYSHATVIVLVFNQGYSGSSVGSVDITMDYVFPKLMATTAAQSVADLWSTPLSLVKGPAALPPRSKFVLVTAPTTLSSASEDTVMVTVTETETESATFWRGEVRDVLIAVAACALGWCFWRYQLNMPKYAETHAAWKVQYGAAAAANAPLQPLGGIPPPMQQSPDGAAPPPLPGYGDTAPPPPAL